MEEFVMQNLVDTLAIRVRESADDLPFWYTAGVPGPFYINVERLVGPSWVAESLQQITEILQSGDNRSHQVAKIKQMILEQFNESAEYKRLIQLFVSHYQEFAVTIPELISGGERRDWFFSVPFADVMELPHLYLFKDGSFYGDGMDVGSLSNKSVLHVSDIVNTATSYLRNWLPILRPLNVEIVETATVAIRDDKGVQALEEQGVSVICPLNMNTRSFGKLLDMGLITKFAHDEILMYLESPRDWTRFLLQHSGNQILDSISHLSSANLNRLQTFVEKDIYELRTDYPNFFEAAMKTVLSLN